MCVLFCETEAWEYHNTVEMGARAFAETIEFIPAKFVQSQAKSSSYPLSCLFQLSSMKSTAVALKHSPFVNVFRQAGIDKGSVGDSDQTGNVKYVLVCWHTETLNVILFRIKRWGGWYIEYLERPPQVIIFASRDIPLQH